MVREGLVRIADEVRSKGQAYNDAYAGVYNGIVKTISDAVDADGRTRVTGRVASSATVDSRQARSGNYYYGPKKFEYGPELEVGVTLDADAGTIVGSRCSCKGAKGGICMHGLALICCYLGEMGVSNLPRPGYSKYKYLSTETLPVETSRAISRVITCYTERSQSDALEAVSGAEDQAELSEDESCVDLMCVLKPYGHNSDTNVVEAWQLRLRIMRGKGNYAVQSIAKVIEARNTGEKFRYGKFLEFIHGRNAFSRHANEILDFIVQTVKVRDEARTLHNVYNHGNHYYELPRREMVLSSAEASRLLDMLQGQTIILDVGHGSTLEVTDGAPQLAARLTEGRLGSFALTFVPNDYETLIAGKTCYVLGHGKALRCPEDFTDDMADLCAMLMPTRGPLKINAEDMVSFATVVLPKLRTHAEVDAPASVEAYAPPKPEFSFEVSVGGDRISCNARVSYGEVTLRLFEPAIQGQPLREVALELEAQRVVRTYFPKGSAPTPDYAQPRPARPFRTPASDRFDDPYFSQYDDGAYFLLFDEGLERLAELGSVTLSERLAAVEVRPAPTIRVDASVLPSGLLDLEVTSTDMTPEELVDYLSSFRRRQRFVRLRNGDILRLGTVLDEVTSLAEGLGVRPRDLVGGVRGLSANRTLFVDAVLKRAEGLRFERNRAFRRIVRDFDTVSDADYTAPDGLADVLRPYQDEGFKWLATLGRLGFGGILADDMGLGKTLQLLAYLAFAKDETKASGEDAWRPALVVCPASLVYNWASEAARFVPALDVCCLVGTKDERAGLIARAGDHDLFVTSYDLLRRDVRELSKVRFSCIALDEAQYVKNARTQTSKAARSLVSDVRFALTGTPIENRLQELWSIFEFLMPGMLGTADSFARRFETPITAGDFDVAERLRALVSPFILRRNKRDVLRDLPDKFETVVFASMEGEQDKLYRANVERLALSIQNQLPEEFAVSRIQVLAELTKLRQICCDPRLVYENFEGESAKLDTCMELVREAVDGGHQLLIFSQFTSMFELIEDRLRKEKIRWHKLTGATSKEERVRLVERFQAGEAPVFLISLKAGGVGLNLTAADVVIHYDPWWNVAAENQATDRTYRIGQTREVSVFKIIAKGTIEEKIQKMQERKRDLAESVIGGEAAASTAISREDLLALLDTGN